MTKYTNSGRSAHPAPAAPAPPASALCPPAAGPALLASPPSALTPQPSTGSPSFAPAPGESPRAFAAFCAYLELGPHRRYSAVARKHAVSVRTIERWASQFDWRERLTTHAVHSAEQFVHAQNSLGIETVAREQSLRERQLGLAEAILNLTERYFDRLDDMDLERVRLPDVCRALEFTSRLIGQSRDSALSAAPDAGLREQLASLLDQAFRETPKPATP